MYKIQEVRRVQWDDRHLAMRGKETTDEYYKLMGLEENFLKQKSRIQWLELGDVNNSFFYRSLMVRRNKNQINRIQTEDDFFLYEEDDIRTEAENYFQGILAPVHHVNDFVDVDWNPRHILTHFQHESLIAEVREEEVKDVIWGTKEGKAQGPDGFTHIF